MKKWKMMLCLTSVFCLLAGCGKQKGESADAKEQSKDYIYSFESYEDKLGNRELTSSIVTKDSLIFMEYHMDDVDAPQAKEEVELMEYVESAEPNTYVSFVQFDYDGNLLNEFDVTLPFNSGFSNTVADDDGNIYTVLCEYGKEVTSQNIYRDVNTLFGYSATGEELFCVPLGENLAEEDNYYVNSLFCHDKNIIIWGRNGIEVYSAEGKLEQTIAVNSDEIGQLFQLRDGSFVTLCYGEAEAYFKKLDMETGNLSERIDHPFSAYNYSYYPGKFCDLILVDSMGVYTYNMGDESNKKIMDFVDSDLESNTLYSIYELTQDSFFAWTFDEAKDRSVCGVFKKVDPATITDKEIVTLGTMWIDSDVRRRVVDFNKSSEQYRIRIEEYSQYNTTEDYTVGLTRLNTDIASGNAPDIICLTSEMPVKSYMSKGLFVDLKTLMENDPELKMEDYMTEVIDAFSQDGKWYQMVPSYYLNTVLGKASLVGDTPGWTFEDMQLLKEKQSEEVQVFSERTKNSVIDHAMSVNSEQFINWGTGECRFNTQEFIDLLEFANEFPSEIDYENLYNDPTYWESQETVYRDGRALLMPYTISNFQDYQYCRYGTFGEEITGIGFPVNEGVGNAYSCSFSFAVSAKSKYPDLAWEFIRYYLTEEYQDSIEYGWPIKLSSLEKKVEAAQKRPYYEDENGNKVEYDDTYYLNGVEIVMQPLNREECDRVLQWLRSAEHIYNYDRNIMSIMEEECAAYFEGQKSAKEVADIIQSRIQIYVNENL